MSAAWETIVGMEVHARLNTESKMFSPSPARDSVSSDSVSDGEEEGAPNSRIHEIDLGLAGVLPVANKSAVEKAVIFGLAVEGQIARHCEFARKHYFYPDLPKGYQISQYEHPVVSGGVLHFISGGEARQINFERAHLEEDAGKLLHDVAPGRSAADYNRAGAPLLEIVSKPELRGAQQAEDFCRALHRLVCWLNICDGNLQKGEFRMDANVSIRRAGEEKLGTRCEIKNLNSFRFLTAAITFEERRQIKTLEAGEKIRQQTRLYDPEKNETRPMRDKEEAHDYCYFPDPDLPPLRLEDELVDALRARMPPPPEQLQKKWEDEFNLPAALAAQLLSSRETAQYFDESAAGGGADAARLCANWIVGEMAALAKRDGAAALREKIPPAELKFLAAKTASGALRKDLAKQALAMRWREDCEMEKLLARDIFVEEQVDDLDGLVEKIIAAHPAEAEQYRAGKKKALGFFVGKILKESGGRADPRQASEIAQRLLK